MKKALYIIMTSFYFQKPGLQACKVCYVYIDESKLAMHIDDHYFRYICKYCGHTEYSNKLITIHVKSHLNKAIPSAVIKFGDVGPTGVIRV